MSQPLLLMLLQEIFRSLCEYINDFSPDGPGTRTCSSALLSLDGKLTLFFDGSKLLVVEVPFLLYLLNVLKKLLMIYE
jgi:hypothetical protein